MVNENMEFEAIVRQWLDNVRLRVKESSYVKYNNLVRNHILPQLGSVKAVQMTTAVVEAFVQDKLSGGNLRGGLVGENSQGYFDAAQGNLPLCILLGCGISLPFRTDTAEKL